MKYLDALQRAPSDPYSEMGYDKERKELLEPEEHISQKTQIARDFNEHVQTVVKMIGDNTVKRENRLNFEWESFKRLDKKYPHLHVMDQVRGEKRFEGRE